MNTYEKIPGYYERIGKELTDILGSGVEFKPEIISCKPSHMFVRTLGVDKKGYFTITDYVGNMRPIVHGLFGSSWKRPVPSSKLAEVAEYFDIDEQAVSSLQLTLGIRQPTPEEEKEAEELHGWMQRLIDGFDENISG